MFLVVLRGSTCSLLWSHTSVITLFLDVPLPNCSCYGLFTAFTLLFLAWNLTANSGWMEEQGRFMIKPQGEACQACCPPSHTKQIPMEFKGQVCKQGRAGGSQSCQMRVSFPNHAQFTYLSSFSSVIRSLAEACKQVALGT